MRRDDVSLTDPPPNDRPGDRWMCGRAGNQAPCSHGPNRLGICPLADACRPKATWQGIRCRVVTGAVAVIAFTLVMISQSRLAPHVFKPGELTTPHAQILSGTLNSERCASCHPESATSPMSWFASASDGHQDVEQTDRCLDCHHNQIDRQRAKLAHNLPAGVRSHLRLASTDAREQSWHDLLPGPAIKMENVDCAACHREHRGADANLMAVSDRQCQTCHADRFGGFATSHPRWNGWPYGRGGDIAFNHASHAKKHFPATARDAQPAEFQCGLCHTTTADKEILRTASYAVACESCHDPSLRIEAAEGIELLALPTLPAEAAETIKPWPEAATGFFNGHLSPLTELLLRSDKRIADAVRRIPNRDFSQVAGQEQTFVIAATTVAGAHRELLGQMMRDGQAAIFARASAAGVPASTLESLVRSLPTQLIGEAYRKWFGVLEANGEAIPTDSGIQRTQFQDMVPPPPSVLAVAMHEDDTLLAPDDGERLLLDRVGPPFSIEDGPLSGAPLPGDDLLAGDDLLGDDSSTGGLLDVDPLMIETSGARDKNSASRFDASTMLPVGGWYRDDVRLVIAYRGGGHDDLVLRSAVELLSNLPDSDPIRQRLLATRGIAACVRCHPSAAVSRGSWRSERLIGRGSDFTRFSHSPHLKIAGMADCSQCHQLNEGSLGQINLVSAGHASDSGEFVPLAKESCSACHTSQAAGDDCIKCHRYHMQLPR